VKPTSLSVSQISDYSNCAKRWFLKRALKTPFQRGLSLLFGTAVHAGLETFNYDLFSRTIDGVSGYSKKVLEVPPQHVKDTGFSKLVEINAEEDPEKTAIDMAHVIAMFEKSLEDQLDEEEEKGADPLKDEWEKIQRQKNSRKALKAMSLDQFREHIVTELKGIGRTLLEQYHDLEDHGERAVFIEERGKFEIHELPFRYVADLVDVYQGKYRLRDYKTRAKSDKTISWMQLVAYAWILEQYHGIKIEIIEQMNFVKTVTKPRIEILPYPMAEYEEDVMIFQQEMETFINGATAGVFPRNISPFCSACGVREVCKSPKKEAEMLEAQRKEELGLVKIG
jgi:CRISPR/Cas system-associated exonuclease Cas4 (RecB family)